MTSFAHEYTECLREAKKLAFSPSSPPSRLQPTPRVIHTYNKGGLAITTRFRNAAAYLKDLRPIIKMIGDDFEHQENVLNAARALSRKAGSSPHYLEGNLEEALHFFKLLCFVVEKIEHRLMDMGWLETPPVVGDQGHEDYLRTILSLETVGQLLTKPHLLTYMRVCHCRRNQERAWVHTGNIMYYEYSSRKAPFLDTFTWDTNHSYVEILFKNTKEPIIYRLPVGSEEDTVTSTSDKKDSSSTQALVDLSSNKSPDCTCPADIPPSEAGSEDSSLPSLD